MNRLREEALLESHIPFLYSDKSGAFKIFIMLFHNVRSLHIHHAEIASDYNVFVETAICSYGNETYSIPNFELFRNDFNLQNRAPYGIAMYVQDNVDILAKPR